MATDNPMNPHTQDDSKVQRSVAPPVAKARVVQAARHDRDGETKGYHTVRVRVYGETSTFLAPVLTMGAGDAHIPPVGSNVAVMYGPNEKPWVVGYWYATNEDREPPEYLPGERVIGTPLNESYMKIAADGHIEIRTEGNRRVDIDHQSASVFLDNNYSLPSGSTYNKIPFDTIEDDPEELFNASNNSIDVLADGLHRLSASAELPTPGQNNQYSIAVFVNGVERKRVSNQSAVKEPLSLQVQTQIRLDAGDVVDIRMSNDSGTSRTVLGSPVTTEFNVRRAGI